MRNGWQIFKIGLLPLGWELREEEDYLMLYDPEGVAYPFGLRTPLEAIGIFALAHIDQKEEE